MGKSGVCVVSMVALTGLALGWAGASSALAQASGGSVPAAGDPATGGSPAVIESSDQTRPVLFISPYAWLTAYDGDAGARGVDFAVSASFVDVLEQSDSIVGLMGAVDVELGSVLLNFNGAFAKAELEESGGRARSGPLGGGVSVAADAQATIESLWMEAMAGYRLVDRRFGRSEENRLALDAFAGLRYTDLEIDLAVTPTAGITLPGGEVLTAGVVRAVGGDADWVEPLVGLRASVDLSESVVLIMRGDVGGFGVDGCDFSWQVVALGGYRWQLDGWAFGLFAGYRALGQDYSSSLVTWDVVTHGPLFGCSVIVRF